MTWRIALTSSLVLAAVGPALGQSDSFRLRWKNGDEIGGQIVSASADRLVWNSPVSSQDVTLDLSVLESIAPHFEVDADTPVEEIRAQLDPPKTAFRVILTSGMTLSGDLKAITPTHVVLATHRLGEVTVERRWIDRLTVGTLPTGTAAEFIDLVDARANGWRSIDHKWEFKIPSLQDWDVSDPGQVATRSRGARLYLSAELPSSCELELTVGSTRNPRFALAFGAIRHLVKGSGDLRLESGSDELLITSASSEQSMTFGPIDRMGIGTRRISLRVTWNRLTGEVSVFSASGTRLADARMALAPEVVRGGILLENLGSDLTITRLKVRSPDAEAHPQIFEGQSRLRTLEGRVYFGALSGPDDDGEIEIRFGDDVTHVATEQVAEIKLASAAGEPTASEGNCRLTYYDYTMLEGDLIGIRNGSVSLRTEFSPEPITCRLAGLKLCEFRGLMEEALPDSRHVLEHAGLKVRGTLVGAETALGWRFVGAEAAIRLNLNEALTIRRSETGDDGPAFADANSDIVLLKSGDLLPCRVESIDEESVVISTDFSAEARIPQDDVQAVSFDGEQRHHINGFLGEDWQIDGQQPGEIERRDDAIVFHDAGIVSHPTLMSGGNLEFDVDWNGKGQSYLIMTLMPKQGIEHPRPARALNGLFVAQERRMFYLVFDEDNVTVCALEGDGGRAINARQMNRVAGPIHVRIQQTDNKVTLFLNDQEQGALGVPDEQAAAMGLMFQTRSRQPGGDLSMTISNLRAGRGDGLFFHLPIMKSARKHVVTVPRMRRDRPPSHVLVGRNGDLLRGRLLSLGPTGARFESRLNDIVLSRDRLSGIVWLTEPAGPTEDDVALDATEQPPVPDLDESAQPGGLVQATFGNGVVLSVSPVRVEGDELVARHREFGECRFSLNSVARLLIGNAAHQTDQTDQQPTFTEWTLIHAPEPVIPGANGGFGTYSELVGQPAEDFSLPLLAGGNFRLSEHRGEIVVLDFWATWCGPCIQAMPQLMAATDAFPDDVRFIGVNQEESPEVVRTFLEAREWDVAVAMDRRGEVGRQFRVQGIPQTVIVGRDGKIVHVHLGASPDLESSLKDVLKSLVTETPPASFE